MELFIDVLIVIGIVMFSVVAGKKKSNSRSSQPVPNQPRREGYTKPAKSGGDIYHKAKQRTEDWRKQLYEADRDRSYDRESLDYCDSDIPASGGITFRDLPAGTDELLYLRRWNHSRERMLEKSLETRE